MLISFLEELGGLLGLPKKEVTDAATALKTGFSTEPVEEKVRQLLVAAIQVLVDESVPPIVATVMDEFGFDTVISTVLGADVPTLLSAGLTAFDFPGVMGDALGDFSWSTVLGGILDSKIPDLLDAFDYSSLISGVLNLDIPSLLEDTIIDDIFVSSFMTKVATPTIMDPITSLIKDWIDDFLATKYLVVYKGPLLEVRLGKGVDWTAFKASHSTFKPFLMLSDAFNTVSTWVSQGIEALAADLPKPLYVAIPYLKLAWIALDESGQSTPFVIPDADLALGPWEFTVVSDVKLVTIWTTPSWWDEAIPNSETWNYLVNDVFGVGSSFDPIMNIKWSDIFFVALVLACLYTAIQLLIKATGNDDLGKAIVNRAIQSTSMSNTQSLIKQVLSKVEENKVAITAVGQVASVMTKLAELFETSNYNSGVLEKINEIKALIGLRLALK